MKKVICAVMFSLEVPDDALKSDIFEDVQLDTENATESSATIEFNRYDTHATMSGGHTYVFTSDSYDDVAERLGLI